MYGSCGFRYTPSILRVVGFSCANPILFREGTSLNAPDLWGLGV